MKQEFKRFLVRRPKEAVIAQEGAGRFNVPSCLGAVEFLGLLPEEWACLENRSEWREIKGFGQPFKGVQVRCHREPLGAFSAERLTSFDYLVDEQGGHVEVVAYRMYASVGFDARIEVNVWFGEELEAWIVGLHVANLFRIISAYALPRANTLMLHSAGVVADGAAYVFVGRSGAGKSTLSALSERLGHGVLSDDINLVRAGTNGGLRAFPSGFFGQYRSVGIDREQESFPVAGIFLLEQAHEVHVAAVSQAMVISQMLVNCPFLNQAQNRLNGLMDLLSDFASRVKTGRLAFCKDEDPWSLLKAFCEEGV